MFRGGDDPAARWTGKPLRARSGAVLDGDDSAAREPPTGGVAALVLVVDPYSQPPADRALVEEALHLSPAESRIAVSLAEGRTVREIAGTTGCSENTIRWHMRQIFEKQGLTRLGQLVALAGSLTTHSGRRVEGED